MNGGMSHGKYSSEVTGRHLVYPILAGGPTEAPISRNQQSTMRAQAEAFKTQLLHQGMRKSSGIGLDKVSINNALKTLKSIWNHAKKLELYTGDNPFDGIEPFKLPQRADKGYLESSQINALLTAAERYAKEKYVRQVEARNVRIAIALMALAGLRKRETCFSRWEWIDWEKKVLVVSSHSEFTTKNKRSRLISMHRELIDILHPHDKQEGYILDQLRADGGSSRYRADFRKSFNRVCEIAGVEATPHDLRHSFASTLNVNT